MYKEEELNYAYDTLEPYIDTHTLALHHDKHYLTYLNNLNEILLKNHFKLSVPKEEIIYHLDLFSATDIENLLFNLGGVINHEMYFSNLGRACNKPKGELLIQIERTFGSYEQFQKKFKEKAMKLKGSGYTYLVMNGKKELSIINLPNQEFPFLYDLKPLLVVDMWEHAYYIHYENRKHDYLDSIFAILNYEEIEKRWETT